MSVALLVGVVSALWLLYLADVDECGEQSSCCEQDCTNYPGGYECYCSAGYRLSSDGCSCDGMLRHRLLSWSDSEGLATEHACGCF